MKHNLNKRTKKMSAGQRVQARVRFSNKNIWGFILIFAAVGGYIIWRISAAPLPPTVYLSPTSITVPASSSFSIQVRENSGTTGVNAIQANISYPTGLLTLTSVSTTGSAFGTTAQNSSGGGTINIALGTTCSTTCPSLTGDQLVATLNFTSTVTGGTANLAFTSGTALVSSTTNTDILGSLSATAGAAVLVDTQAPVVSLSAPASGSVISAPSTTVITAAASDNDRVASVDIYIDTVKVSTVTTSPYSYSWNTSGVALGSHTIQAKATDPSGNIGTSTVITITLADQTAPTASITAPAAGTFQRASITVSASATDNVGGTGISKVELYVDGSLKASDTTSPYSFSWDTTTASNAPHSLTVKAYDGASPANTVVSSAVSVTVDNSPPTTPGNFQSTGSTLSSISLSWTASSDNNSVTGYRISRNGTAIATVGAGIISYTDSSLSSTTTYSYSIVALDSAGNASAAATLSASTLTGKVGDINGDNKVDITDLSILLSNWGSTTNSTCDLNKNGVVDIFDLSILLSHFGT